MDNKVKCPICGTDNIINKGNNTYYCDYCMYEWVNAEDNY